jgi:hypothetical protein
LPKLPPNLRLLKLVWLATPKQFTKEWTVWPKRSKPSQVSINTCIFPVNTSFFLLETLLRCSIQSPGPQASNTNKQLQISEFLTLIGSGQVQSPFLPSLRTTSTTDNLFFNPITSAYTWIVTVNLNIEGIRSSETSVQINDNIWKVHNCLLNCSFYICLLLLNI